MRVKLSIISSDIIRAEVRIGRPRDSMCEAQGILILILHNQNAACRQNERENEKNKMDSANFSGSDDGKHLVWHVFAGKC